MRLHDIRTYRDLNESVKYHIDNSLTITESVYRIGSTGYADFVCEVRRLWYAGKIKLNEEDQFIVEKLKTGTKAIYKDKDVVLDSPEILPKGNKKEFIVYRDSGRTKDGKIVAKKIEWGDPKLKVKNCDEGASKSFRARHRCDEKTDMDTPGWWACSVHLFWKQLGLECSDPW
jgi:hypothetical protein